MFPNIEFDWKKIYILPRITTIHMSLRSFQYKILNNFLFLNKLFVFPMKKTPSYYFCNKEEETALHIFSECTSVINLWQQLVTFFENNLILPALTLQTALLGLWSDDANHDEPIINHAFLIYNLHVYNSREEKHCLNTIELISDTKRKKDKILLFLQQ